MPALDWRNIVVNKTFRKAAVGLARNHPGVAVAIAGVFMFAFSYFCEKGRAYQLGLPESPAITYDAYMPSIVVCINLFLAVLIFIQLSSLQQIIRSADGKKLFWIGALGAAFLSLSFSWLSTTSSPLMQIWLWLVAAVYIGILRLIKSIEFRNDAPEIAVVWIAKASTFAIPIVATFGIAAAAGYIDTRYQHKWPIAEISGNNYVVLDATTNRFLIAQFSIDHAIYSRRMQWVMKDDVVFEVVNCGPIRRVKVDP